MTTKLLMAAVIFVVGLAGGLAPRVLGGLRAGEAILRYGSALAGGIFLGAGVIHLLGDSHEYFAAVAPGGDYPLFLMVGGVGFLLILLLEKVLVRGSESGIASSQHPLLLMIVLSLHSLIAGTALGLEGGTAAAWGLLAAILAHKAFAAFALSVGFVAAAMPRARFFTLLAVFAATTPAGVVTGALLGDALQSDAALELEAIFDGLAGGTFIYVASMDIIGGAFDRKAARWPTFAAIAAGFALMALLAIWT